MCVDKASSLLFLSLIITIMMRGIGIIVTTARFLDYLYTSGVGVGVDRRG